LAAVATAAAVFGVGMLVLPSIEEPPPSPVAAPAPPPPLPPPPEPPPPPPPPPPPAAAPDATTAAVPPSSGPEPKPVEAAPEPKPVEAAPEPRAVEAMPEPKPTSAPPEAKAVAPNKAEAPAPREKLADKDVARDAWRKNLPDVAVEPGKAAMLIPIKGSIDGATYHLTGKPRSVLVTLPKGESMITMPFYNVRHDGFRQVWIKKDDETGTSIRVVLGEVVEPQVEIKDDFVRVTIRRPVVAPAAAPDAGHPSPSGN
jgi:hypothetical protein